MSLFESEITCSFINIPSSDIWGSVENPLKAFASEKPIPNTSILSPKSHAGVQTSNKEPDPTHQPQTYTPPQSATQEPSIEYEPGTDSELIVQKIKEAGTRTYYCKS
jgi:hypothetical protein